MSKNKKSKEKETKHWGFLSEFNNDSNNLNDPFKEKLHTIINNSGNTENPNQIDFNPFYE